MGMKSRIVFLVGAGVGAAVGVGAVLRASGANERSVRDELQQSLEAVMFRLLDMTPFENKPSDIVLQTQSTKTAPSYTGSDDVVLDDASMQSASGAAQ